MNFNWRTADLDMTASQVYGPGAGAPTPAAQATASAPDASRTEVDDAIDKGLTGQPIAWWVALIVLLAVFMYATEKITPAEVTFSRLRLSAYNILVIVLAVFIGVPFFKLVFTRFKVRGLSALVHMV